LQTAKLRICGVCLRGTSFLAFLILVTGIEGGGILQLRNGYFWDPATSQYFIPHGIAYQTWNPPVGANQSFEQLDYDLVEFKKMYANSVRAEFVWNVVENPQGVFHWEKPDHLVAKAEELGLRLFVLIGYQYAPDWFPNEWKALNDHGSNSVVLAYENPYARQAYSNYIAQVTARYKNSPAIAAWILGNEYAYFDLWDPSRRFLGFDPYSVASFHAFLAARYTNDIALANANWGTNYSSFDAIPMPQTYPPDRKNPLYYDLIQWRKKSIGNYVAVGALTAKQSDPNHLRSYSMVGALFGEEDIFYTCEDARTIVASCADAGAPLDFWSINNYAMSTILTELRSVDYGIGKHRAASGLPVLVTETGHTSTETQYADASARQGAALPTELWASLMSGAIGVHVFTWNDRDLYSGNNSPRERGFGIVAQSRLVKSPAYPNVAEAYRRMEQLHLDRLLGGTSNPPPDIQFYWSQAGDMGWCRANHENYRLWSTFKRLGYEPWIIQDEEFDRGAWRNASALCLSRGFAMEPRHLDALLTNVAPAGVHLHASADLPGQFDAYGRPTPDWTQRMDSLFGLNVAGAYAPWDAGAGSDNSLKNPQRLNFTGVQPLGLLGPGYTDSIGTWKFWQGLTTSSGVTIVTDTGLQGLYPALPALVTSTLGAARTAINTFAIGDTSEVDGTYPPHTWDLRYNWLRAIYRDYFGLIPLTDLTGPGSSYVYQNYRLCPNGSVLIGLLNGHPNSASVTLTATNLLAGKTVENLTTGGIVDVNSGGSVGVNLFGDDYVLLYAYNTDNTGDHSLINPNRNKLWIQAAPMVVWPNGSNWNLTIGFDTRDSNLSLFGSFERRGSPNQPYARSTAGPISGKGTALLSLLVPEADLNDPAYISSPDGGQYVFHAWLEQNGVPVSETFLPVRMVWGIRPLGLPATVVPGASYSITVEWQELPSWLPSEGSSPLDRARLWQPYLANQQYYKIVLQLLSAGQVVAGQEFLTCTGTGEQTMAITVPPGATGPFRWAAFLETAPNASVDLLDSFEDRATGTNSPPPVPPLFSPWQLGLYAQNTNVLGQMYFNAGIDTNASDGAQGLFVVVTNPPTVGDWSGAFLTYSFVQPWALPHDYHQWTNYTFSCDFKEHFLHPCILELQLVDARGGQIHFTNAYMPNASNGWSSLTATLDQFTIPPWVGSFDSTKVSELVVNVQMLQTNAMYLVSFDNIRFQGPAIIDPVVSPLDVWDGFDDRNAGSDPSLISPASSYSYAQNNNAVWLAQGISSQAADGGQAAFIIVSNPPNPGAFSGLGLYYGFTNEWALPADHTLWTNYSLSYDFKENNGHACVMEMQIKSGPTNWIQFTNTYSPGANGWDSLHATLDQFFQPPDVGLFDPTHVQGFALNIRMLEPATVYEGLFDNVYFDAPDQPAEIGTLYATYTSANGSLRLEAVREPSGNLILTWPGNAALESAPEVNGVWTNVPAATSPYTVVPSAPRAFYRLRQ
jgi:hypothetical protein